MTRAYQAFIQTEIISCFAHVKIEMMLKKILLLTSQASICISVASSKVIHRSVSTRQYFHKYWLWSCVNVALKNVRRAANQFSGLPSTKAICLTTEKKKIPAKTNMFPNTCTNRLKHSCKSFDIKAGYHKVTTYFQSSHISLCLHVPLWQTHTSGHTNTLVPWKLKVAMGYKSCYVTRTVHRLHVCF